jgi:chlorobactene glucosyltransferase
LCAVVALGYVARCASFAGEWEIVPVRRDRTLLPSLSVLVPARNEERSIERCVRSMLAQELDDFEVIVIDDRSDDGTGEILTRIAAEDPRLLVVRGEPLPDGWVGKPWALAQGAAVARGSWLLFTDADSVHESFASRSTLSFAFENGYDAVTLATGQDMETWAERAILPSILGMVVFATGPVSAINDPMQPDRALANGQYILVSREAYDALGGHAAIRGEIVDDLAFARRLKADGRFRLALAGGWHLCRVRMYHSAREIWLGFTKNAYAGSEGRVEAMGAGIAMLSLLSFLPVVLGASALARRRWQAAAEMAASLAAVSAASGWAMREVGIPRRLGVYAPVGFAVFAAISLNSTWRVLSGRGVEWRGRRYDGRAEGDASGT